MVFEAQDRPEESFQDLDESMSLRVKAALKTKGEIINNNAVVA